MRSQSRRSETLATLSPEQLRAVSDGRARVTRSGRLIPTAPQSQTRHAGILGENPNRGRRRAAPTGSRVAEPRTAQPYSPLTVSWPTTDAAGRRNPRIAGNLGRGRNGYRV